MKATLWKTYYRLRLGNSYAEALNSAKQTNKSIMIATQGGVRHRFNQDGKPIRENHNPAVRHHHIHPLILKYS